MSKEQQLISRVVKADAALQSGEDYTKFVKQSPQHKEWAEAIQALRVYAKTISSGPTYIYRSAKTGRIVTEKWAKKHPSTTVREKVKQ